MRELRDGMDATVQHGKRACMLAWLANPLTDEDETPSERFKVGVFGPELTTNCLGSAFFYFGPFHAFTCGCKSYKLWSALRNTILWNKWCQLWQQFEPKFNEHMLE
jgi:hypothetical protein